MWHVATLLSAGMEVASLGNMELSGVKPPHASTAFPVVHNANTYLNERACSNLNDVLSAWLARSSALRKLALLRVPCETRDVTRQCHPAVPPSSNALSPVLPDRWLHFPRPKNIAVSESSARSTRPHVPVGVMGCALALRQQSATTHRRAQSGKVLVPPSSFSFAQFMRVSTKRWNRLCFMSTMMGTMKWRQKLNQRGFCIKMHDLSNPILPDSKVSQTAAASDSSCLPVMGWLLADDMLSFDLRTSPHPINNANPIVATAKAVTT